MIALPDPLKEVPSRPPILEEADNPLLKTDFHKAVVTEFDSRFIDGSLDAYGRYQLDVDVNSVTFTHHHLFSREHVLAYRLAQLCQQHAFRSRRRAAHFLTEKLRAAKAAAAHVRDTISRLRVNSDFSPTSDLTEFPCSPGGNTFGFGKVSVWDGPKFS